MLKNHNLHNQVRSTHIICLDGVVMPAQLQKQHRIWHTQTWHGHCTLHLLQKLCGSTALDLEYRTYNSKESLLIT